ncbi:ATP-binding cassette domain-containing protein [Streptomyces buecherae]|uniref:ATP-binding cassette domain-containing protein n=1 Tax=Streptomyces buecherae TaxID=2763006 RepID=UPI001E63A88B|nr:ATP-binding cassette domain-containing protein [Streptomyces buecherae]
MLRSPRPAEEAHSRSGAAVTAEGLGVRGPRGWAFRDISVAAEPGALIAITGPSGSGRTCLLLALTGRMRVAAGHAEVGGHRLPRQMTAVRRSTGLGPVPGVTDLEPALTVAEHLRERALLTRRFGGSLRGLFRPRSARAAESRARIEDALHRAGLDVDALPKGARTAVRDLERLEVLRLSVALALIGAPRLLAVDDTDLKLSPADRARAWSMLRGIAEGGTTVLAVCSEPPADAVVLSTSPHDRPRADDPAHAREEREEREEAGDAPASGPATQRPAPAAGASEAASAPRGADGAGGQRDGQNDEQGNEQGDGRHDAREHEGGAFDAIAEAGRA